MISLDEQVGRRGDAGVQFQENWCTVGAPTKVHAAKATQSKMLDYPACGFLDLRVDGEMDYRSRAAVSGGGNDVHANHGDHATLQTGKSHDRIPAIDMFLSIDDRPATTSPPAHRNEIPIQDDPLESASQARPSSEPTPCDAEFLF
jgi:hypothetical protein